MKINKLKLWYNYWLALNISAIFLKSEEVINMKLSEKGRAFLYSIGIHLILILLFAFKSISVDIPRPELIEIDLALPGIFGESVAEAAEVQSSEEPVESSEAQPVAKETAQPEPPPPVKESPKPAEKTEPPPSEQLAETPEPELTPEALPELTPEVVPEPVNVPVIPKRRGLLQNRSSSPTSESTKQKLPEFDVPMSDAPEIHKPVLKVEPQTETVVDDTLGIPERQVVQTDTEYSGKNCTKGEGDNSEKDEGNIYSYLEGEVSNRKILTKVNPKYPEGAIGRADIKLKFEVNPDGIVSVIIPVSKGGDTRFFEQAAINALRQWRFEALLDNVPQENQNGFITFFFRI